MAINRTDNVNRLLAGILATGLAPRSFYAGEPVRYDGVPVDDVARAIVTSVLAARPGLHVTHASNSGLEPAVSLDQIVDWLETGGARLERLPHAEWVTRFRARLDELGEAARAWSPAQVIARWARPIRAEDIPRLETRAFLDLLGESPPAIDEPYVHRWRHALGW